MIDSKEGLCAVFGSVAALSVTDIAGIVGAAAGVVAVVGAFLVYRWQRERKHLDYEFVSGSRLLSRRAKELEKIELRYEGNNISDPYLMLVRFINTGNKPIVPEDFNWPVHIEMEGLEKYPLSVGVAETSNPDLRAEVFLEPDGGTLEPLLLNPGDSVTMSLLLDGAPSAWNVRGRVVGVKEFRPYWQKRLAGFQTALSFVLGGLLMVASAGVLTLASNVSAFTIGLASAFFAIGVLICVAGATERGRLFLFYDRPPSQQYER